MLLRSPLLIFATLAFTLAATRPTLGQDSAVPAGEAEFWQRIVALAPLPSATQLSEDWFETARARRQGLLARTRLYLTLYPGGAHRDDAIRLELTALFELGTLQGGTLAPLRARVDEILRAPPSAAALHEAAYWALLCRRCQNPAPARQPVAAPLAPDVDPQRAYAEYIAQYPRSQYVPRLAALLLTDAAQRGNRPDIQRIIKQLTEYFPGHATTTQLAAEWRRAALIGEPFWPIVLPLAGCLVEARDYVGHPALVVVWAGFDEPACCCVLEIERFRRAHPELRVIGVSLDESMAQTTAAAHTLGINWPQCNDRLGWGGAFVRFWGIDHIPYVLAVDRAGNLAATGTGDDWEALARRQ
jgi:hypothetical protein